MQWDDSSWNRFQSFTGHLWAELLDVKQVTLFTVLIVSSLEHYACKLNLFFVVTHKRDAATILQSIETQTMQLRTLFKMLMLYNDYSIQPRLRSSIVFKYIQ